MNKRQKNKRYKIIADRLNEVNKITWMKTNKIRTINGFNYKVSGERHASYELYIKCIDYCFKCRKYSKWKLFINELKEIRKQKNWYEIFDNYKENNNENN